MYCYHLLFKGKYFYSSGHVYQDSTIARVEALNKISAIGLKDNWSIEICC